MGLAFDPDPNLRWLFAMTHPDDEISIIAWLQELARNGNEVWLSWTHHNPIREAEARRVAERLGVPQERLLFHGATDGEVCDELLRLREPFQAMIEQVKPDRVVAAAFEQGHLDHDATNWLIHQAFTGAIYEVPLYYSYLTRLPRVNRFADPSREEQYVLTPEQRKVKIETAKSYPSQRIWVNMVFAEMRSRLVGDGSLVASERLRLQTSTDFTQVALPEPLASRVRTSTSWQRWLAAIQAT